MEELERFADFSMAEKINKEIESIPISSARRKRSRTGKPVVDKKQVFEKYAHNFALVLGRTMYEDSNQYVRILDAFESIRLWTAHVDRDFHNMFRKSLFHIDYFNVADISMASEVWNVTLTRLGVSSPDVSQKFKGRLTDDENILLYDGEFFLGHGFLGFKSFGKTRRELERKFIVLEDEDGEEFTGMVRCFVGHTGTFLHMPIFPLKQASIISIPGEMTFKKGRKEVPYDISLEFEFDNSEGFELAEKERSAAEKISPPTGLEFHDRLGLHLHISKGKLESKKKYEERKHLILEHIKTQTEKPAPTSGWRFAEIFTGHVIEPEDEKLFSFDSPTFTPPYTGRSPGSGF